MDNRIEQLEAEVKRLKAELEKAAIQEKEFIKSRRAMLFMLEDLNTSSAALARAKADWEATFDAISIPLFIHDKEFRIIRANKAYRDVSGMDFRDFIGRLYFEIFPRMEGPFKMCLNAVEQMEAEVDEIFVNNDRIFKARFYPIKTADGRYLYSVHALEDISNEKTAEKNLKDEMEITTHLLMIAEATAHMADVDKLMKQVLHCGSMITGCSACLSYLWDKETKVFRPGHSSDLRRDLIPIFSTELLDKDAWFIKEMMEKEEPVIIQAGGGKSAFGWVPGIKSCVLIPFLSKKRYLGLMALIYTTPVQFTDKDMRLMRGISNQVSTALEEARLHKESIDRAMELSHKIETIQVMHEIDKSILSTFEFQEIMDTAVRMTAKIIPCDRATVALVDRNRKGFIFSAGFGVSSIKKGDFVAFEDTNTTEVIETGRPQYEANLSASSDLPHLEKEFLKEGFLSHIRVLLNVKGEAIGVLTLGSKRPSAYTPGDLSTLEKMAGQISVALENARLVSDLEELFMATVSSLSAAIDAKSPWTAGHSERVTRYAVSIAKEMGFPEKDLRELELAGLLHDIGKIGTYEHILDKPGILTPEEMKVMKQHPAKGAEILAPIKQLKGIIPVVKHHHEFYDGTGYPDGVNGESIPVFSRILAVADSIDAMGSDRPYRKERKMDDIINELRRCSGTQFDPRVVDAFLKTTRNEKVVRI